MPVLAPPVVSSGGISIDDHTPRTIHRLREFALSGELGALAWQRPGPSAAFSRRDVREPGFELAVERVRSAGFEPFVRPVGGRLAAYHDGALVLDLLLRCDDPRIGTTARFQALAQILAAGLRRMGVDARVGRVPGEYCPGDWSVNAGGTFKLVGTGQRLVRDAVLLTAVVVVADAVPLREVMADAYADLGLELDPRTVGSVSDVVPGVTLGEVEAELGAALEERLELGPADLIDGRRLHAPWTPL